MGVTVFVGELDEHEKLVEVLRQVDIVIVTFGVPLILEQMKIIRAMKEAVLYTNSSDGVRISPLPPFQTCCDKKKLIRRAAEESGIPYTFVSANSFGAYFVNSLLHPYDQNLKKVTVYGTGEAKFGCNYEKDIAEYTVKAATDERAENGLIIYRLPKNVITQLDLISRWERKTGRTMEKTFISDKEMVKLSQSSPFPEAVGIAIFHSIFVKGEQMNYELKEDDLDAVELYPDYDYTTVDQLLDIFVVDPPERGVAAFQ
nr:PREDICTED: eugenol synthase 1-like [Daucus carota subsp. sativus]